MNDRIISILDNYDMTVLRTWKGRSAILCETEQGIRILKEYTGPKDKLCVLENVTKQLQEAGFLTDCVLRNKEGELCSYDRDHTAYIVKEYYEGRECSVMDSGDCMNALKQLAGIHKMLKIPAPEQIKPWRLTVDESESEIIPCQYHFRMFSPIQEYDRYNRELKRIWKHLRNKSTKTDFEVFLLHNYGFFMEQALEAAQQIGQSDCEEFCRQQAQSGVLCHGDLQHHNILFAKDGIFIMNYEKCLQDVQIRDVYLFFRKIMEKNNWDLTLGERLISAYDSVRSIDSQEMKQMYYRLSYPEKFRKVVSYYYNSGKSWIPGKNREKLERLLAQEQSRQLFLKNMLRDI